MEPDAWDELFDELYLDTYDALLEERDAGSEAMAAATLAGATAHAAVLDAPCGFGRHSIPLARAGFRVTGVDRSPVQLEAARERAAREEGLTLLRADFRELPLADGSFDAVLNLFTSIGYRGESGDGKMLREFRRVLKPEGALVVETLHRDRLMSVFQAKGWDDLPGGALRLERRTFDHRAGEVETLLMRIDADGTRRSITYRVRVYTATELVRLLGDCGFGRVELFGALDGSELTRETRLVAVARP